MATNPLPLSEVTFLSALLAIATRQTSPQDPTHFLRQAILTFGSETTDNQACASRLSVTQNNGATDLTFTNSGERLSDFSWSLEDIELPVELATKHPNVTNGDWDAFTRLVTLLFMAINHNSTTPTPE